MREERELVMLEAIDNAMTMVGGAKVKVFCIPIFIESKREKEKK